MRLKKGMGTAEYMRVESPGARVGRVWEHACDERKVVMECYNFFRVGDVGMFG